MILTSFIFKEIDVNHSYRHLELEVAKLYFWKKINCEIEVIVLTGSHYC